MPSDTRVFKVFLSVGKAYTREQEIFLDAFEVFLLRNGCEPHTIGRRRYKAVHPILAAREDIETCDAAIVLAFTRYEIDRGTEFPRSSEKAPIDGWRMPTPWNQLEGGMAWGLKLPMLILIEEGLKRQGILSEKGGTEWFPQEIKLTLAELESEKFKGIFKDWKKRAEKRLREKEREKSIGKVIGDLSVRSALSLLAMLGSMLVTAFWFGHWVAQKFGPLL